MSLLAQAKLTEDNYIIIRVAASAAAHGVEDPHIWTMQNIWALSATPGWKEAYASVLDGEVITEPANWGGTAGADPDVITDQMIEEAVAARVAALTKE